MAARQSPQRGPAAAALYSATETVAEPTVLQTFAKNLVVGGAAGVCGALASFPIDLIKTRLQAQDKSAAGGVSASAGGAKGAPVAPQYKGLLHGLRTVRAQEGFVGLYRGLPAQLVGIIPEKAIKLSVNDLGRRVMRNRGGGKLTRAQEAFAGGLAGFSQTIITTPYELIKLRMQLYGRANPPGSPGFGGAPGTLPGAFRLAIKEEGLAALYRGQTATLLREVPYAMIYFTAFADFQRRFARLAGTGDNESDSPLLLNFVSGALAASIAAGFGTPADCIKTRLQSVEGAHYKGSVVACGRDLVMAEGFFGLFKGTIPRIVTQAPLMGLTLGVYEALKHFF